MQRWSPDHIRAALAGVADGPMLLGDTRQAAVAAVLRPATGGPEVLLMRRAERIGDPWSGHVSLPGGRREPGDLDLRATAIRETREELALTLDVDAELLGPLPTLPATARGKILPMSITPYVFIARRPIDPQASDEAVGHFWLPLAAAAAGALDEVFVYPYAEPPLRLPCWAFAGHTVWGLTYQVLRSLLVAVGPA